MTKTLYILKIQDGARALLQIVNRCISTKNHPILMKFGTHEQIWNSVTAR